VSFEAFLIFIQSIQKVYINPAAIITSTLGTCKIGAVNRKVEADFSSYSLNWSADPASKRTVVGFNGVMLN
jgi:hypothetical protein